MRRYWIWWNGFLQYAGTDPVDLGRHIADAMSMARDKARDPGCACLECNEVQEVEVQRERADGTETRARYTIERDGDRLRESATYSTSE